MSESNLSVVEEILGAFSSAPLLGDGWVIDDRFSNVVMRVLTKDQIKLAWAELEKIFEQGFEEESLDQASRQVRHLASVMGGLRDDQYLFVREWESGLVAFTAIWPWQNAPQASLRLGFIGVDRLDPSVFDGLLADS